MAILIYLIGVGLAVGGTTFALVRYGRRPDWRAVAAGLGGGFAGTVILSMLTSHFCREGQPVHLLGLLFVLIAAVGSCVRPENPCGACVAGLWVLCLALSWHHIGLAHTAGFTDHPTTRRTGARARGQPEPQIRWVWHTPVTQLRVVEPPTERSGTRIR